MNEPPSPTPAAVEATTSRASTTTSAPTSPLRSVPSGGAARSLRVGVMLGVVFLVASVAWDALVAPGHLVRLLAWRGGGAIFLVAAGALSFALPHRSTWLGALATAASAVSIAGAALILPYGFAYAIGGLVLVAMAIGFISRDGRAAAVSSIAVLGSAALVLLFGRARDDMFYAIGFFLLPALTAAVVFAHLGAERAARARQVRRELLALREDLARFGRSDELTGVYDLKQLQAMARREIALARRQKRPLSALKIDIRQLRAINEQHGRHAGDEALRAVASMCQGALRETDVLGRVAGDEFVAVLPEADADGAAQICDRLRRTLRKASVLARDRLVEVSVAVGAATLTEGDRGVDDLLRRADAGLRAAPDDGHESEVGAVREKADLPS